MQADGPALPGDDRHPCQVTVTRAPDAVRIAVAGDLDSGSSPGVTDALLDAIAERSTAVLLDLGDAAFVDSSGLRSILQAREMAARDAVDFRLVRVSQPAERLLDMIGLRDLLLGDR